MKSVTFLVVTVLAAVGCIAVGWRSRGALVAEVSVLAVCLGVMLRQDGALVGK